MLFTDIIAVYSEKPINTSELFIAKQVVHTVYHWALKMGLGETGYENVHCNDFTCGPDDGGSKQL
jgi:hypothetical protein